MRGKDEQSVAKEMSKVRGSTLMALGLWELDLPGLMETRTLVTNAWQRREDSEDRGVSFQNTANSPFPQNKYERNIHTTQISSIITLSRSQDYFLPWRISGPKLPCCLAPLTVPKAS